LDKYNKLKKKTKKKKTQAKKQKIILPDPTDVQLY